VRSTNVFDECSSNECLMGDVGGGDICSKRGYEKVRNGNLYSPHCKVGGECTEHYLI
jgi:hypothetical protein